MIFIYLMGVPFVLGLIGFIVISCVLGRRLYRESKMLKNVNTLVWRHPNHTPENIPVLELAQYKNPPGGIWNYKPSLFLPEKSLHWCWEVEKENGNLEDNSSIVSNAVEEESEGRKGGFFNFVSRHTGGRPEEETGSSKDSPPDSVRPIIQRAIKDAEQIVSAIKMRAQVEAGEEAKEKGNGHGRFKLEEFHPDNFIDEATKSAAELGDALNWEEMQEILATRGKLLKALALGGMAFLGVAGVIGIIFLSVFVGG